MPRSYMRTTLEDFAQPIDATLVEKLFVLARARRPPVDALHRTSEDYIADIIHTEIAVPRGLAKVCAQNDLGDYARTARTLNNWLNLADSRSFWLEICSALLGRTEDAQNDRAWEDHYDSELTRVFGATPGIGRRSMKTTHSDGINRWTLLVAAATVDAMTTPAAAGSTT